MTISIFINLTKKNSEELLKRILQAGKKYNINFLLLQNMVKKTEFKAFAVPESKFISECQYAVVIGGDGTFISAAHLFIDKKVPLLGINIGNFGFLTEVKKEEIEENLSHLRNDNIKIEERLVLDVRLERKGRILKNFIAVNEAVVNKGGLLKIIKLKAFCDKKYIGTFTGDGAMVSTPTGSTAYSLSASGPIIYPIMETFIFNTICPHTLAFRPIIIPSSSTIVIENISDLNDITLTVDGFEGISLQNMDRIIIKRYKNNLKLITSPDRNFFDILREKFNWVE